MKYQVFDYPNASELNSFIYEIAQNDIKTCKPASLSEAVNSPHIDAIRVDGGGILTSLNIHKKGIGEIDKFFEWIEKLLDIKTQMSWIATYNSGQSGGKHCHMEFEKTFSYYVNVPEGSPSLILEGDIINPVVGRVVAFSGQLEHEVPLSSVDGRCSLVGHGS